MDKKDLESKIIENYQQDEKMMIFVFAQWCVNQHLDPEVMYRLAYPKQAKNQALKEALELTVPINEAGEIPDETLFGVLSLYGNEDLAIIVTEEIEKRDNPKNHPTK